MASDNSKVNHPKHYQNNIEVIDTILAMGYTEAKGFLKGNIIKYLLRSERKGGLVDLQKAHWYLNLLGCIELYHSEDYEWSKLPTAKKLIKKYGGTRPIWAKW